MQKNYIKIDSIHSTTTQDPTKVPVYVACQAKIVQELGKVLNKLGFKQGNYCEVLLDENNYEEFIEKLSKEEIFKCLYRVVGYGKGSEFGKVGRIYVILETPEKDFPIDCFMSMRLEDNESPNSRVKRIPVTSITEEDLLHIQEETKEMKFKTPLLLPDTESISDELEFAFGGSVNFDLYGFGYNFDNNADINEFILNTKKFLSRVSRAEVYQHRYIEVLCNEIENENDVYIISMKMETLRNVLNPLTKSKVRSHLYMAFKSSNGLNKIRQPDQDEVEVPKIPIEKVQELMSEDWI